MKQNNHKNIMNNKKLNNKNTGVTLLELLVALAIVGILAAYAVPAFNSTIDNSRLTSNTNLIVGGLNLARSEAITRSETITFEANGNVWQVTDSSNNVIKLLEPSVQQLTITPSGGDIVFSSSGFRPLGSVAQTIEICDSRSVCRCVNISISGSSKTTQVAC